MIKLNDSVAKQLKNFIEKKIYKSILETRVQDFIQKIKNRRVSMISDTTFLEIAKATISTKINTIKQLIY